jgi:hypothetical protein
MLSVSFIIIIVAIIIFMDEGNHSWSRPAFDEHSGHSIFNVSGPHIVFLDYMLRFSSGLASLTFARDISTAIWILEFFHLD